MASASARAARYDAHSPTFVSMSTARWSPARPRASHLRHEVVQLSRVRSTSRGRGRRASAPSRPRGARWGRSGPRTAPPPTVFRHRVPPRSRLQDASAPGGPNLTSCPRAPYVPPSVAREHAAEWPGATSKSGDAGHSWRVTARSTCEGSASTASRSGTARSGLVGTRGGSVVSAWWQGFVSKPIPTPLRWSCYVGRVRGVRDHPLRAGRAQSGRDRRPRRDLAHHGHLPRRSARGRARHPGAQSARLPAADGAVGDRVASLDRIAPVVRRQAHPGHLAQGRRRVLPVDPGPVHGPARRRPREALSRSGTGPRPSSPSSAWVVLAVGAVMFLRSSGAGGGVAEVLLVVALAVLPAASDAIAQTFHPQDLMSVGLICAGMAQALRRRWVPVGVVFGVAFLCKQFAVLPLLGGPRRRPELARSGPDRCRRRSPSSPRVSCPSMSSPRSPRCGP